LDREVGASYRVGFRRKLALYLLFRRNVGAIETLSNVREHLELASAVLRVPADREGDVVECGCYLGGSSVNLSLVCALTGRRLVIYDSFAGLPEPTGADRAHLNVHAGNTDEYYEGRFAAALETVRANIGRLGNLRCCEFVPGFFEDTMPRHDRPVAMAFLDVDLVASLRPCLVGLWPHLLPGGRIYLHEARSLRLAAVMFDEPWWQREMNNEAPGLVGAGSGLPLVAPYGSELGYAQKPAPAT
jgi:O-methyltransferase